MPAKAALLTRTALHVLYIATRPTSLRGAWPSNTAVPPRAPPCRARCTTLRATHRATTPYAVRQHCHTVRSGVPGTGLPRRRAPRAARRLAPVLARSGPSRGRGVTPLEQAKDANRASASRGLSSFSSKEERAFITWCRTRA
jgi:hypothetical protein